MCSLFSLRSTHRFGVDYADIETIGSGNRRWIPLIPLESHHRAQQAQWPRETIGDHRRWLWSREELIEMQLVAGRGGAFAPPDLCLINGGNGRGGVWLNVAMLFKRCYPQTMNHRKQTNFSAQAAARVSGAENVVDDHIPADFGRMLSEKSSIYVWIATDPEHQDECDVHNHVYGCNDRIPPLGAGYRAQMTESFLAAESVILSL